MQSNLSISYNRLIVALFAFGLIATCFALFWITLLGSRSIAEHEISRTAKSQAALTRLVVDQYFERLEIQIRSIASDPDIRAAIEQKDLPTALRIAEQATLGLNNAVLDLLLIDLPSEPEWLNVSLGLVDIREHIPAEIRNSFPPDLWVTYTNHDIEPEYMTAALSVSILHPESGELIGKIVGGIAITDSYILPGLLADTLSVFSLGLFHENEMVAGVGDITTGDLPNIWPETLGETTSALRGDTLYIATPLKQTFDGHLFSAVIKQPVDTLQKVDDTYLRLFPPFLLYTLLLTIGIALLINKITSGGLRSLLTYTSDLSRSNVPDPPPPGLIREFNQLAKNFHHAFEVTLERDAQFRELIDDSIQGMVIHSNEKILYINNALLQILDYGADELVGQSIWKIYAPEEHERMRKYRKLRLEGGVLPSVYEVKALKKTGDPIWVEQHVRMTSWNGSPAIHATVTDIQKRKAQKKLIEQYADYDVLTGLPNRTLFLDCLRQDLVQQEKSNSIGAVFIISFDLLKSADKPFVHETWDPVLQEVAKRIERVVGSRDTVSQLGYQEFAVLLTDIKDDWKTKQVAQKILQALSKEFDVGKDKDIEFTANIGVSVYPLDSTNETTLLKQAESARDHAKSEGHNQFRFFSKRMNERAARALLLETTLGKAIEDGELDLSFQPAINVDTGKLIVCDAAVYWQNKQLGLVTAAEITSAAEDAGLTQALGKWTLQQTCTFYRSIVDEGHRLPAISISVSSHQCCDPEFSQTLKAALKSADIDPSGLRLELSDGLSSRQIPDLQNTFPRLAGLGVKVTLGNFGISTTSLEELTSLPIDMLKIDRALTDDAIQDPNRQKLVKAITTMANSMNIQVICNGADTREVCLLLRSLGCSFVQGDYVAPPMDPSSFKKYIREKNPKDQSISATG
ncbi:EAL domain-containing protein [Labrenzia sp. PHM005]|uniref:EAL domain-containing protein n=1 Tax=Labrenzia sp. PHM005 TaxID=2590016 RepID=UPI00113FEF73|nr:EAL domain-containing protein [Labrenzia sp. PHM005]QDG74752.1 EAL domain-containing protein [Labrenzia sp. PHM005]